MHDCTHAYAIVLIAKYCSISGKVCIVEKSYLWQYFYKKQNHRKYCSMGNVGHDKAEAPDEEEAELAVQPMRRLDFG